MVEAVRFHTVEEKDLVEAWQNACKAGADVTTSWEANLARARSFKEAVERCCVESGCPHGFLIRDSDKPGPYVGTSSGRITELETRLKQAAQIIEVADNRAMAADGPVGHARDEMSDAEWRQLYLAITGKEDHKARGHDAQACYTCTPATAETEGHA